MPRLCREDARAGVSSACGCRLRAPPLRLRLWRPGEPPPLLKECPFCLAEPFCSSVTENKMVSVTDVATRADLSC